MERPLTIWLLNPYHTGSHRAWAEGYASHSRHRVRILGMTGNFWKWRMHGGALELAEQARALLATGERPDLLLATSMVNLPAFLALVRREIAAVPVVLYMHENQLTYPPPPGAKRDLTYGMIQHLSMLAADRGLLQLGVSPGELVRRAAAAAQALPGLHPPGDGGDGTGEVERVAGGVRFGAVRRVRG